MIKKNKYKKLRFLKKKVLNNQLKIKKFQITNKILEILSKTFKQAHWLKIVLLPNKNNKFFKKFKKFKRKKKNKKKKKKENKIRKNRLKRKRNDMPLLFKYLKIH